MQKPSGCSVVTALPALEHPRYRAWLHGLQRILVFFFFPPRIIYLYYALLMSYIGPSSFFYAAV